MNIKTIIKTPIKEIIGLVDEYRENRTIRQEYKDKLSVAHTYLKINPQPKLSINQIKEINDYWSQYGIKILDYGWFQWYYGITGISDPRFIPQDIYSYIVWPYYDNEEYCSAWKDKNFFERFLPDIPFPHNYLRRIHGRFFNEKGELLSKQDDVIAILVNAREIIVKDAWDSGEGRGVKKYEINSKNDALKVLKEWNHSKNYLIQELLVQHEVLSQFNESSVNIMRINSWRKGDKVHVFSPTIRIGMKGQTTDVCYVNGVEMASVCAIESDGSLGKVIADQHGRKKDTSQIILNPDAVIPRWNEIIELIKVNHKKLDHFDIIGWDFTVTNKNEIKCVEYNVKRPGTVFYQYIHGPFFGDLTDDVLSFLRKKENRNNYIPKWMKITR